MFGRDVVEAVEKKLKEIDMPKGEFYKKSGISSATFSQWRNGTYEPSTENLSRIEECLGLSFAISQKEKQPSELEGLPAGVINWVETFQDKDELIKLFTAYQNIAPEKRPVYLEILQRGGEHKE